MMNNYLKHPIATEIERISVPQFNLAAIRARASDWDSSSGRKPLWLPVLLIFVPLLAAAATILPSPQLRDAIVRQFKTWHVSRVVFERGSLVSADQALRDATFHLILPSHLPAGAKLRSISESGERNSFIITYALSKGDAQFEIRRYAPKRGAKVYFGREVVLFLGNDPNHLTVIRLPAHTWIAGDESVIGSSRHMNANQFDAVKKAMAGHDAPMKP